MLLDNDLPFERPHHHLNVVASGLFSNNNKKKSLDLAVVNLLARITNYYSHMNASAIVRNKLSRALTLKDKHDERRAQMYVMRTKPGHMQHCIYKT